MDTPDFDTALAKLIQGQQAEKHRREEEAQATVAARAVAMMTDLNISEALARYLIGLEAQLQGHRHFSPWDTVIRGLA